MAWHSEGTLGLRVTGPEDAQRPAEETAGGAWAGWQQARWGLGIQTGARWGAWKEKGCACPVGRGTPL